MVGINGLFQLLINGIYQGYNPIYQPFTIFLGHPSVVCIFKVSNSLRIPSPFCEFLAGSQKTVIG